MPPIRNGKPPKGKAKKSRASVAPYTRVMNPVSVGSIQKATPPRVTASAKSCRIVHRELLDMIDGSDVFESRLYRINPGVSSTFPWLSGQAQGWEQYKFSKLILRYLPTCSTTETGIISMFVDYDPTDSPPTTIRDAMTNATATAGPVRNGSSVVTNTTALLGGLKAKYVETQLSANDADRRSTDCGNFFICTEGGNNIQVGAVWIEYDVEFLYPQRATPSAYSAAVGVNGPASNANPFGVIFGAAINTVGHLISPKPGVYPDGTTVVGEPLKVVTLQNLVGGATYLFNMYTDTTGSSSPTSLVSSLGLNGVPQVVDALVGAPALIAGRKNASFTYKVPDWVTAATKIWVSIQDNGSVFAKPARLVVDRIPDWKVPLAFG